MHNQRSVLSWLQFIGSVIVILIYIAVAYMMANWNQDFGCLQDVLSLLAIILNLPPFMQTVKSKWLATLIYLLCIWVCTFVICLAFSPVTVKEWSTIASLVAFLSVFIITAGESKFIQSFFNTHEE